MAKLHYVGREDFLLNFSCNSSVEELCEWYKTQSVVQFDTETTVTNSIVDRELRVMQFGDLSGNEVFVIQKSHLTDAEFAAIKDLLRDSTKLKIIHNASFDYQVMLKYDVILENVWDTMVMEQILYAGYDYDLTFFALKEVLLRRFHIDVSKEQQAEFGNDEIDDEKLLYAATDVVHLGNLYLEQKKDLKEEDLLQLGVQGKPYIYKGKEIPAVTENEVVLAFADIEYNGMGFDPVKWRENIAKAQPIVDKATTDLNTILLQEPFYSKAKALDIKAKLINSEGKDRSFDTKAILSEDVLTINFKSAVQTLNVLKYIFPNLKKSSVIELKSFLQENDPEAPKFDEKGKAISSNSKKFVPYLNDLKPDGFSFLKLVILKKYDVFEQAMLSNFRERLIKDRYLLPKDSVMINWNSHPTKLSIFKWFDSSIESTDAEVVENHLHLPFFQAFQQYQFANSLISKYGEKFIEKNVDPDGRVRTRFNTILSTGRVSSSQPNIQQIPANALPEDRQNDYRNCFTPGYDGWSIVGSDFASQELAVIATLSGDLVWLDALKTGKDLHSVAAELIYGDIWKNAAEPNCAFYALDADGNPKKAKCKCKEHKHLRTGIKKLDFGLSYGMSEIALAADLKISKLEAKQLMDRYFSSFSALKGLLDALGHYGMSNGFVRTPAPLRRKRYFPYWKGHETSDYLLKKIGRAAKNMPIQGFSADITKIAVVLLRRRINETNTRDSVKLFCQVHDQIDSICKDELDEFWAVEVTRIMEMSAAICLGNELLKTDTEISKIWQK